jgi:phage-related protein
MGKDGLHKVYFYRDKNGNQPVLEYMRELSTKKDKSSRVQLNKMNDYIQMLSEYGTYAGEPYVKHLSGDIWELRPQKNRILFVSGSDGSYVLLHHFVKKSQKTPAREIERAKRELAELKGSTNYG